MIKKMKELIGRLFHNEFVRFLFVGGINTLFGYGVFFLFEYLTRSDAVSLLMSNVLGIIFNFNTLGRLVFKSHHYKLLIKFFLVYGVIYVLNLICLKVFHHFGMNSNIGQAILVIPVALLSYLLNKIFVFNKRA